MSDPKSQNEVGSSQGAPSSKPVVVDAAAVTGAVPAVPVPEGLTIEVAFGSMYGAVLPVLYGAVPPAVPPVRYGAVPPIGYGAVPPVRQTGPVEAQFESVCDAPLEVWCSEVQVLVEETLELDEVEAIF